MSYLNTTSWKAQMCSVHGRYQPPHVPKTDECPECNAIFVRWCRERQTLAKRSLSTGATASRGKAATRKGRRTAQAVAQLLLSSAPWLDASDVQTAHPNQSGPDLRLSRCGRETFPFAVEVKCQESVNIWAALNQAEKYSTLDPALAGNVPVVFLKRAKSALHVLVNAKVFLAAWMRSRTPELFGLRPPCASPMTALEASETDLGADRVGLEPMGGEAGSELLKEAGVAAPAVIKGATE